MKKTIKFLSIILITVAMMFAFVQPISFADRGTVEETLGYVDGSKGSKMDSEIGDLAGTVTNWIWGISLVVAVIVLMIIGVQFIIGGTQQKAEYKKALIPVVVGIIIVVFATTIVKFLFSMK